MPLRKIDQIAKFQAVDEDALIIPKETIEKALPGVLELNKRDAAKVLKADRKPPSEAQIEARKKFAEYAKQKAQERKEAKLKAEEEAKQQAKLKQEELLKAATHVKVIVKPHKLPKSGKRVRKVETTTDTETTDTTETETDITDTETDTDMEDYKQKARKARVQAKRVVRTIKKIDQVLQAPVPVAPQNPYAALLASRWR